jgi:hypothetical protein
MFLHHLGWKCMPHDEFVHIEDIAYETYALKVVHASGWNHHNIMQQWKNGYKWSKG